MKKPTVIYAHTLCNIHYTTRASELDSIRTTPPGSERTLILATLERLIDGDVVLDVGSGILGTDAKKLVKLAKEKRGLDIDVIAIDPMLDERELAGQVNIEAKKMRFEEYITSIGVQYEKREDYGFIQNFMMNALKLSPRVISFWGCFDDTLNESRPLSQKTPHSGRRIMGNGLAYVEDMKNFLESRGFDVAKPKSYCIIAEFPFCESYRDIVNPGILTREFVRRVDSGLFGD